MSDAGQPVQDLVLVGGGHAHALVLRMLAMAPIPGVRLTLISPASHTPYSGMLPGLVAGHYCFEQTHIDLSRLCQWAGVRFICSEVTGLDPQARRITLRDRPPLDYDVLSLDIGSEPDLDSVPGAREFAIPVKPVAGFWQRWQALLGAELTAAPRVAVVGGGAGGVELALAMAHVLAGRFERFDLYCAGPQILPGYNASARRAVEQALDKAGIHLHCQHRVTRVDVGELYFESGAVAGFDELFWCTGATPAPWVAASGLHTDTRGFLALRDTLQSVSDERVFGAGDIATQRNHPRPKAGVYAVRQGPVLAANLRAYFGGRSLRLHNPQRRFLSLLSLGERRAVAVRGPFSAAGAWVWRWKHRIDSAFMRRFNELPPLKMSASGTRSPRQMPCAGCGAKVGGDPLLAALQSVRTVYPQHCLPAGANSQDVALVGDVRHLVQSIDGLRALDRDEYTMGRLAAQHALSDVFASGARAHSALALITLPYASPAIQQRDLEQVLLGALREFSEANCVLLGGHSMQSEELQIAFAVNGVLSSGRAPDKRGARADDQLILCKPLGTGVIYAAHMQLRADGRDVQTAMGYMLQSNSSAARIAREHKASAMTDVTGFGLLGHLSEMLSPDTGACIELAALPLLHGAFELAQAGIHSTLLPANISMVSERVHGLTDPAWRHLLFDPQTGGGLLLAVPAAQAESCVHALCAAGYTASRIGALCADAEGTIRCV
jgi:selenide,water dikinase